MPEFRYRPDTKKAVKPYWNYRLEISIENKNLLVGHTRNH